MKALLRKSRLQNKSTNLFRKVLPQHDSHFIKAIITMGKSR